MTLPQIAIYSFYIIWGACTRAHVIRDCDGLGDEMLLKFDKMVLIMLFIYIYNLFDVVTLISYIGSVKLLFQTLNISYYFVNLRSFAHGWRLRTIPALARYSLTFVFTTWCREAVVLKFLQQWKQVRYLWRWRLISESRLLSPCYIESHVTTLKLSIHWKCLMLGKLATRAFPYLTRVQMFLTSCK